MRRALEEHTKEEGYEDMGLRCKSYLSNIFEVKISRKKTRIQPCNKHHGFITLMKKSALE